VLALERAVRRPPAGILIHGLGGIGKTTLAKGCVQWLADNGGLYTPPFRFTFNDIHSSEHVINPMVGVSERWGTLHSTRLM
jgi:tRNA A37 threonylcarbamoyladenosine biosynthesis protein TsaE